MASVIVMPRLSPTMEEGVLLRWRKREGEQVNPGDVIAEIETDKANMEFPLEDEGTLLRQLVREGETVKLGAPVAVLGQAGENAEAALAGASVVTESSRAGAEASKPQTAPHNGGPPRASPLVRKLASERGIDLRGLRGSGPGGRIVLRDLEGAPQLGQAPAAAPSPSSIPMPAEWPRADAVKGERPSPQPLSQMRKAIARRLREAQAVPHYYLTREVRADEVWRFYRVLRDQGQSVTLNDMVVKAAALALEDVPAANASLEERDGELVLQRHPSIDIGIAVALDEGLITPVVRRVNEKGLGTVARESKRLAERARARSLRPEEYSGATFTVSNLGMHGIEEFTALLNPPEAGILAVGALGKRPAVVDDGEGEGRVGIERRMRLTMTYDHRVIDGALGARLLGRLVEILEHPLELMR